MPYIYESIPLCVIFINTFNILVLFVFGIHTSKWEQINARTRARTYDQINPKWCPWRVLLVFIYGQCYTFCHPDHPVCGNSSHLFNVKHSERVRFDFPNAVCSELFAGTSISYCVGVCVRVCWNIHKLTTVTHALCPFMHCYGGLYSVEYTRICTVYQNNAIWLPSSILTAPAHAPSPLHRRYAIYNASDSVAARSPYHIKYDMNLPVASHHNVNQSVVWSPKMRPTFWRWQVNAIDWVSVCERSPSMQRYAEYRMSCVIRHPTHSHTSVLLVLFPRTWTIWNC